jgi:hypothetical protein
MSNGNSNPKVNVTPVGGTGITEVGMFNISVTPVNPTDTILALQFIASIEGQPEGDFSAFVFIGDLPQGAGLSQAIFYASCDAVMANQTGKELTVLVVGGINSVTAPPFDFPFSFTGNLWPGASCSMIPG